MLERVFRLIIGIVAFATLFLRWNPLSDPGGYSNAFFIYWTSLSVLSTMFNAPIVADLGGGFSIVLFLQAIPLLILFNGWLVIHPSSRLEKIYRILVFILFLLAWYESLFVIDPGWRGVGFWAHTAVISVAALIEVVFVIREQMGKRKTRAGKGIDQTAAR